MASVPQLLDALCEALLPRARARPRAKRGLRRAAYEALLAPLWAGAARRARAPRPGAARTPPRSRALLLAFELRVAGLRREAERLEELLGALEAATAAAFPEPGAALELLVLLAGSGPPRAPRPRHDPLAGAGPRAPAPHAGYDCAALSERERDVRAALCREERRGRDSARASLRAMDAAPGRLGRDRDPRAALFGRAWDLDVRLDLPPVPDGADLFGLAIKVPHSIDQSEDEGFQSASNLTPDSQTDPGLTPDIDLWDAALTYKPSKRRCWEQIGCPPGFREEPYLTEAGRDAFDHFRRLYHGQLQALGGALLETQPPVLVTEGELVKDALNVLIGVASATFSLCQLTQAFVVTRGTHVSGASPESVSSLLSEVAACGTHYMRLSHFSVQSALGASCCQGLVFQAFTSGLRRYLQYYRACVLATPPSLSLLSIAFLFKKLGRQLRYLAELCGVGTVPVGSGGGEPRVPFPTGVKLLSYLYQEALDNCSNEHYPVLLALLKTSCEPYTRFIHDWVYSGVFRDVYGEFMIQVNPEYLGFRDKFYWTHGYVLISKEVEDCVPVFLKDIAHDVYVCGKTINLLKLCCPRHYLCWSEVPVPRISVLFSLDELWELQKDCALYVGRMERVARHSSVSKEQEELRMEIAKQELIVQAWEAASRVLRELSDRQMSERMALDARKREQFQKLKEQFIKDQERRRAARQEKLEDDFSYARELRDREKRLRALEEQLERQARQALVERYSSLSAEAARREQRALWRIERHRLANARLRFLSEDQKHLQEMLKDLSEGKAPPEQTAPSALSQASSPSSSPGSEQAETQPGAAEDEPSRVSAAALESDSGVLSSSGPQADPGPFSEGLNIGDFLPPPGDPQQSPGTTQALVLEEALQTIGSDLPCSSSVTAEYDFRTVLRASSGTLGPLPTVGDSVQVGQEPGPDAPLSQDSHVLGHSLEAGNVKTGEPTGRAPARPRWNVLGHVSDASVKVQEHVWDVMPFRPRWNVHGHVSDASVKVGEHVWDVAPSRPRWNIHGHVSDSSVKIGEHVWDVAPTRPRWNIHGHVSDSSVKIGEHVWDVAPSRPRWNIHGHVSQSQVSLGLLPQGSLCEEESQGLGAQNPGQGALSPDPGAQSPELGAQSPDPGAQSADPGALNSDPGAPSSDPGVPISDPEALSSDPGAPSSDLGAPSPDPAALSPDLGAQPSTGNPCVDSEAGLLAVSSAVVQPGVLEDGIPKDAGKTGDTQELAPGSPLSSQGASSGLEDQDEAAAAEALRKEQAYVVGLASQYRLEQYPDTFAAMSEPPVARLLHHGLPRACALPGGSWEQPAEPAVQPSELLPLPVLMKHSLTAPLAAHISLVNKAAVDYFFVELRLEAHLEALRHFLLMEDGEFAQSLSDLLFEKLGAGQTPGELLTPLVLNSLLSKALQYSLHGHGPLAHNLSFALKFLPEVFAPNAPDVLSCLELRYKVDWPLNLVVTERCLGRYSGIFSFLLQLKLMMWTLKDVCFHLKRTALLSQVAGSVQFRQLQLFKHEMQHFVKVIQGYIANQILHVTWCEFRARLATVRDLEEMQRAHAEYLHKAVFRGLLTEKAAPVMNIIHSLFSLVLKFRSQLISQPWGPAHGPRGAEHPNFALMQQSYNTFKYYSHFLFKVVSKLVNRGYQPHLEDFLLRINFNNYYQDLRAGQ